MSNRKQILRAKCAGEQRQEARGHWTVRAFGPIRLAFGGCVAAVPRAGLLSNGGIAHRIKALSKRSSHAASLMIDVASH